MIKKPKVLSRGEEEFHLHCKAYGLSPLREHVFYEGRGWRFDFAFPRNMIAVEIEGGTKYGKSRHSRGDGFVRDCEKYNAASLMGWRVLRFTSDMVSSGKAIDTVMEALTIIE